MLLCIRPAAATAVTGRHVNVQLRFYPCPDCLFLARQEKLLVDCVELRNASHVVQDLHLQQPLLKLNLRQQVCQVSVWRKCCFCRFAFLPAPLKQHRLLRAAVAQVFVLQQQRRTFG